MRAGLLILAAFVCLARQTSASVFGKPERVRCVGAKGMAVAREGNRLFAGAGGRLHVLDVSDPLSPVPLGELDGFDNLRQIRARGNLAYVVSRETGLRIVDVSDPAHMRILSRYDTVEFATGVEVAGDVAFVSERIYGVEAVDVRDPRNPAHIAIRKTSESQSCRYRDGYLYSGEWGAGLLTVFDAHDMSDFRKLGEFPLGGFGDGVELDGKYIYCSTGHDALHSPDGRREAESVRTAHRLVRPRDRDSLPRRRPRDDFAPGRRRRPWSARRGGRPGAAQLREDYRDPQRAGLVVCCRLRAQPGAEGRDRHRAGQQAGREAGHGDRRPPREVRRQAVEDGRARPLRTRRGGGGCSGRRDGAQNGP